MGYNVILLKVPNEVSFSICRLLLQLLLLMPLRLFKSICKKLHIRSGPPNILLYLLPNYIVQKVLIP